MQETKGGHLPLTVSASVLPRLHVTPDRDKARATASACGGFCSAGQRAHHPLLVKGGYLD